jgi:D-serine deaminase-like pyridoxal phosphate-dependent protein
MNTRRTFFINTLTTATALAAAKSANIENRIGKKDWRGVTREDLPTPAMIIDLDLFEKNLNHMSSHCKASNINFRGHVKIHKSVDIAKRQMAMGSIGVTVATEAEAELMSNSGVKGVLLTRQAAGKEKTNRMVALAKRDPTFHMIVDDPSMADQLDMAAGAEHTKVNVVVDINAGLQRAGIEPGAKALALAQRVAGKKNLSFKGLMAYSGGASHTKGWEARKAKSMKDIAGMLETAEMCKKAGLPVEIKSGGSTGTYNIDVGYLTELQAGSYMFMDTGYIKIGSKSGHEIYDDFAQSLTVLTTVIVRQHAGVATTDAGIKSIAKPTDTVKGRPDVAVDLQGAEYGILRWKAGEGDYKIGDKVELYPTHLDASTHVYDRYYIAKGDNIIDAWPIMGKAGAASR